MKTSSPLLGFNNNVRHKGRVFHIQTEDSGVKHPHIITHLFADGGRILKTTKTSYAEHVGTENIADLVRHLMQEQHKAMFIALRDGQFDHLLEDIPVAGGRAGAGAPTAPAPTAAAPAPSPNAQVAAPPVSNSHGPLRGHVPDQAPPPRAKLPSTAGIEGEPAPAPPSKKTNSRPKLTIDPTTLLAPAARGVNPTAVTMVATARTEPAPPEHVLAVGPADRHAPEHVLAVGPADRHAPVRGEEVDLDLDALERAAAEAQTPFFQQIQDLPPPPAAVLGKRSSEVPSRDTSYRTVGGKKSPLAPQPLAPAAPAHAPSSGRYAPSRPATIFHNARPAEGASIFGEDLISEKSLDEVILSYLAEDLDAPSEKK